MEEIRAEIVCVGTELLSGKVNTHAAYLSPLLRLAGLSVVRETTVDDDRGRIRGAVAEAGRRAGIVIVSGGLGPTFDDLTREAVSEALGVGLQYHPSIYTGIRRKYARFKGKGAELPENNKRQAWLLSGAGMIDNPRGSAPGQWLDLGRGADRKTVILLPGPFRELDPMFREFVLPRLRKRHLKGRVIRRRRFRFYGISESAADQRLAPILRESPGVSATILANLGLVDLEATSAGPDAKSANAPLKRLERELVGALGGRLYGFDEDSLASVLGARLKSLNWTLAAAESCTGGLAGTLLTEVPGISAVFKGGIVAYHNDLKSGLLGVSEGTLKRFGAVSAQTAREMADGARRLAGADAAFSITGIAGPSGGTRAKPAGLVFVAVATPKRTRTARFLFPGERPQIRERAAHAALHLTLRSLPY